MALSVLCLLTGCASSTKSAVKVRVNIPELPPTLQTCPKLATVSSRVGDAAEVGDDRIIAMWAQDRAVAVQCRRRLETLAQVYENLRENLANHPDQ